MTNSKCFVKHAENQLENSDTDSSFLTGEFYSDSSHEVNTESNEESIEESFKGNCYDEIIVFNIKQ